MELACAPTSPSASVKTASGAGGAQARSLSTLKAAYPSACQKAQFDQYSDYSEEECSDFGEVVKPLHGSKSSANRFGAKFGGLHYDEMSTTADEGLLQSADETTDAERMEFHKVGIGHGAVSELSARGKRMTTGESSTDVPPSGAELRCDDSDSDADGFHQKSKSMTPLVYPLTIMLQIRALVAATAPPPQSKLQMKDASELVQTAPVVKARAKRTPATRQGPPGLEDKISKTLKSILNSLTNDTVAPTLEKLSGAGIQTVPQLVMLVHEIVEKACANQQLAGACAELCLRIKAHRKFSVVAGADGEPSGFRQLLLDECWPRYQLLLQRCNKALQETEQVDKRHAIGNVKFMGELMARGLVSPRLLVDSAEGLLNAYMSNRDTLEVLEALIALLMAACPRLDLNRGWVHATRMDSVFVRLREMVRKQSAPLAVRLLLRDVLSLRDNGWCVDKTMAPVDELRTCVGRSVDREPPKPKQMPRPVEPASTGARSMLSLAREMLLAPVDAPRRSCAVKHHCQTVKESKEKERSKPQEVKDVVNKAPLVCKTKSVTFNPVVFHREVSVTLRDLGSDGNTQAAVQRIKAQNVPTSHQAKEYADLLTRVAEISRKAVRHSAFSFAAALVHGAFDASECLAGVKVFFDEVYADLCEDVPQLPTIIRAEFLPTLQSAFPADVLKKLFPENL